MEESVQENKNEPLILKDIKELSPEVIISSNNSKMFSLFESTETINSKFFDLTVSKKQGLRFLEVDESLHLVINVQKGASLDLVIIMNKEKKSLIIEAFLEEGSFARVSCISTKEVSTKYYADVYFNSRFEAINFSLSSFVSQSKIFLEDNASCLVSNSYYNSNKKSEIKDLVIHKGKNTSSLINSKGYLLNSKTDSRGLIRIEPSAFDARGFQESSVLLEGDSSAVSVPDLEILNNEVKCSHGSTISRIKDEDLFYFESRGIVKEDARKMLITSYLLSILPEGDIRDFATRLLERGVY